MSLGELLSHFKGNDIWVDLCTPIWRKCDELVNIKEEILLDKIINMKVSMWEYRNKILFINM